MTDYDNSREQSADDAQFIGWQQDVNGRPMALYNIIVKGHPCFGSTVTKKSLHEMHLMVPQLK